MFVAAIDADPTDADYAHRIIAALVSDNRPVQARAVMERAIQLGLVEASTNGAEAGSQDVDDDGEAR
jgi:hypothetical protein